MITAAVAAGITVTFGSPFGGVFFAIEVLTSNYFILGNLWKAFVCATVALIFF